MVKHRKKKCLSLVFCDRWVVFCTVIIKSILCLAFALSLNFEVYVVYIYEDRDSEFQIALMLPACSKQILPNKNNTIWMFFFSRQTKEGCICLFVSLCFGRIVQYFIMLSSPGWLKLQLNECNDNDKYHLFGDKFLLFWS